MITIFFILVFLCCFVYSSTFQLSSLLLFGLGDEEDAVAGQNIPNRDGTKYPMPDSVSSQEIEETDDIMSRKLDAMDVLFPVHNLDLMPLNNADQYEKYINGCREMLKDKAHVCDETEQDRINMNKNQPPVMQVCQECEPNYLSYTKRYFSQRSMISLARSSCKTQNRRTILHWASKKNDYQQIPSNCYKYFEIKMNVSNILRDGPQVIRISIIGNQ